MSDPRDKVKNLMQSRMQEANDLSFALGKVRLLLKHIKLPERELKKSGDGEVSFPALNEFYPKLPFIFKTARLAESKTISLSHLYRSFSKTAYAKAYEELLTEDPANPYKTFGLIVPRVGLKDGLVISNIGVSSPLQGMEELPHFKVPTELGAVSIHSYLDLVKLLGREFPWTENHD